MSQVNEIFYLLLSISAFNSLCAYASVNHLHWHLYYLDPQFEVPVSHIKGRPLTKHLFEVQDYPAKGYAFQMTETKQLDLISGEVYKVTSFYISNTNKIKRFVIDQFFAIFLKINSSTM